MGTEDKYAFGIQYSFGRAIEISVLPTDKMKNIVLCDSRSATSFILLSKIWNEKESSKFKKQKGNYDKPQVSLINYAYFLKDWFIMTILSALIK